MHISIIWVAYSSDLLTACGKIKIEERRAVCNKCMKCMVHVLNNTTMALFLLCEG